MQLAALTLKFPAKPSTLPVLYFVGSHALAHVNASQKGWKLVDDQGHSSKREKFSRRLEEISLYDFKGVICMQDQDIFLRRCILLDVRF